MTTTKWLPILMMATLPLVTGCKNHDEGAQPASPADTPTKTATQEIPGTTNKNPNDVAPTTAKSYIDDVTTGHGVGADNSVPREQKGTNFAPGQPIYVSMKVDSAPAGSAVRVDWYGPDDKKIDSQTKKVATGDKYIVFKSGDTTAWTMSQSKDYRAEIWIGDEKANTEHFNIVTPDKADKVGSGA